MSETKQLNKYPYFPYPSDPLTRFGFIVGDIVACAIIVGMVIIPLKSVLHF